MFFGDPVAAFANIRRSLRPGGGLALLAWRDLLDAFSFVSTFGITRGLTHDLDEAGRVAALEALHASLVAHDTDDGVVFRGSAWLVTAGSGP